jgi:predicted nucleotide-binding protein (sugar kinase/HSP70/actin superfamily)
MPPKIILTTATTLGLISDTNMANIDLQVVMMGQLYKVVDQLTNNGIALDNKINSIGISKIKMPSIERFSEEKVKLKRFLT